MSTTLLVHPTSLSLTTLPRVGPSTALQFPTRFPKGAEPRTAMSPAGHTYLWADSLPVVWEYDSKGRRVGEIKLTSSRERVKAVGCGEGVVIASTAGTGIWKRVEGKWTRTTELEQPLPFLALTKAGLLYPSPEGLTLHPLDSSTPTTFSLPSPATHISASKTGRVAICSGTDLHFLTLSTGDVSTVSLPEPVDSSTWIDGSNVAVRASGRLYLVTSEGDVSETSLDPVLNIHVLPPKRRPCSRASISTIGGGNVLGESSAPNRPDRRVSDIAHSAVSGEKGDKRRLVSAPALPAIERLRSENGTAKERTPKATPKNTRSSPQSVRTGGTVRIQPLDPQATRMGAVIEETASIASSPAGSVASRRVSGDWATPTSHPAPGHSPHPSLSAPTQAAQLESPVSITDSSSNGYPEGSGGISVVAFEEMRREIANLQLDMLRMGRGLKNEIRAAVSPLVEEIRANREVIAKQREEIERLRRGY
ncbi:hypothetical protein A1Q1_06373 [Trichosporon asahii var. asahii CBS 2479]|uniref:Uncharacterized protein n=1 Tax=Trichosporon asahii var. asahii (strain ATCC 90039 / CBS 2479 / JCM 2466 / KCTC 7840 / NBRC 103889/ NCYC 2677 / UAMH 7654) TaxID=1186058 RepID=J4U5H4_TRIAS|nr:hypothetical protein A1Q1_06373 [Trichosporon asahii var. asahii CBS 2479]EJT45235.1 hypothetical protein A1Q1_06373 [Trichosporon asahii var. asahii CBS 2479]